MNRAYYDRLSALFARACNLDDQQLAEFMEVECRDDPQLRDELDRMLRHDRSSRLEPFESRTDVQPARRRDPPKIDGYEASELLGRGGMGEVWRALQLSTRREVALKVLPLSGLLSDNARARFQREAELAARIAHPNVAQIYESGIGEGGAYYAMELVDGVDLATFVEREKPNRADLLRLMATVCRAVEQAHHRGVLHRDLKPSNILVTETARPVLVDFGVATSLWTVTQSNSLTADGLVAGTPAYMSPEQASGQTETLDTRSDVYSLGVILYRLVLGKLPYDTSGTPLQVVRRIVEDDVKRPRHLDPKIDRNLEALMLKALARDPDRRYGTAGELAHDLENYLVNRPISARHLTPAYVTTMYLRRHRLRVATGAVFALLIAAAVVGYVIVTKHHTREALALARRASEQRREALVAKRRAERLAYMNALQLAVQEVENQQFQRATLLLETVDRSLKGWEWRHLRARAAPLDESRWQLGPYRNVIRRIAFSNDSRYVAIGTASSTVTVADDPRIVVADVESGRVISELVGHDDGIFALTFTPDGRQLLSGGRDRTLRRWDVASGNQLEVTEPRLGLPDTELGPFPFEFKFSPDGQRLAMAFHPLGLFMADVTLQISWESILQGVKPVVSMSSEDDCISFSPDGDRLFWTTRVWQGNVGHLFAIDVESGEILGHAERPSGFPFYSVDCSNDGKYLVVANDDSRVSLLDASTLDTIWAFTGHPGQVRRASFLPHNRNIVSLTRDDTVRFLSMTERSPASVMHIQRSFRGFELAVDPSGKWLCVSSSGPNQVRMFRVEDVMADSRTLVQHRSKARHIALAPDSRMLVSVGDDGYVHMTNIETKERMWSRRSGLEFATAVTFSRDGRQVIVGSSLHPDTHPDIPQGELEILDPATGDRLQKPIEVPHWIWDLSFDAPGDRLAVAMGVSGEHTGRRGSVAILAWPSGDRLQNLEVAGPRCRGVQWLAGDTRLVTAAEGQLAIWNVTAGEKVCEDLAKSGRNFVRVRRNGKSLLTGADVDLEERDAQTLRLLRAYRREQDIQDRQLESNMGDALVTPDGTRVISGSWNKFITVWDAQTGGALLTFQAHDAGIHGLAISTDGKTLVSCGHDGNVRVWRTD